MARVEVDQELMAGLLALQLGFVTRDALAEALRAWSDDGQGLGQVLIERDALRGDQLALVEALVRDHHELLGGGGPALYVVPTLASGPGSDPFATVAGTLGDDPFATRAGSFELVPPATRFRRLRPHAKGALGAVFVAHDE